MLATYHNHTRWSDGKNTVEEVVRGAREQGIDILGISDHFALHPSGGVPEWSMDPARLDAYVAEIRQVAATHAGDMAVLVGLEIDWYPGVAPRVRETIAGRGVEYVVGSVHDVDGFTIDGHAAPWERLDEAQRNAVHRRYWQLVRDMAEARFCDVAAHLDLPKKFGFRATIDLENEIEAALDAIAASGMAIEINTAGWHKPVAEAYPAPSILLEARSRAIPLMINADAHQPQHLLRDFGRAIALAKGAGYGRLLRFGPGGERFEETI